MQCLSHTSCLVAPDHTWTTGYSWYPDTPGAYPASKWSWHYNSGGLYDQVHFTRMHTEDGFGHNVFGHPCSILLKYSIFYDSVQVHASSDAATVGQAVTSQAHTTSLANPNAPDFAWQRGYGWYPDTPGVYPDSKMTWYYNSGGLYDQVGAQFL